ncbi:hypothetical protein HUK80_17415 [Flavobacterium sp. MAH-1]|uniref:DUF6794 domain-containing protein n=1 Tax=Flavobacterium agri TaxID=2743471 RepID=A0A7Y9C8S6_9FLAO|nr:DUF6794 domain-containing protein [Flavobacterium agri]NUY82685.1 hypothetical protein [Flavobacterium agri]NYA72708.1 hypothetical protein [Flavobacterium agri]
MRHLLIFVFIIFSLQSYAQDEDVYIPKNLEDSFRELDKMLPQSYKDSIKLLSEDDFSGGAHFGLGIWMRNNWEFWKGSRLSRYFNNKGIKHPDDMSGIILDSYHRYLNNQDIKLDEQILSHKEYWKGAELTQLPKKKKFPDPDIKVNGGITYGHYTENRRRHAILYYVENPEMDKYWIYDYFIGWRKINKEIKAQMLEWRPEDTERLLNEMFPAKALSPNRR